MKILIVSASSKKRFSTSMYFSFILKYYLLGHKVEIIDLKSVRDYNKIVEKLDKIDALVFAFPVYVDAVPSTVLEYLKKLENYTKDKNYNFLVYTINNCGFYEGDQCEYTLNMVENWCEKARLSYGGGIGIGAGEMFNILRINMPVGLLISLIELILHGVDLYFKNAFSLSTLLDGFVPRTFIICTLVYIIFSLGMFIKIFMFKNNIVKRKKINNIFTTVWFCPKFLFVILASIYWAIRALVMHGVLLNKLFNNKIKE